MKEDLFRFFYKREICRKLVCKNVDILYYLIWQSIDNTNQIFLRIRLFMRYFQTHIISSSVFNSNCISNISDITPVYDISACSSNCWNCNSTSCTRCSLGYHLENGLCEGMESGLSATHSN